MDVALAPRQRNNVASAPRQRNIPLRWRGHKRYNLLPLREVCLGSNRVLRGGCFNNNNGNAQACRSAYRNFSNNNNNGQPSNYNNIIGFRLVCLPAVQ